MGLKQWFEEKPPINERLADSSELFALAPWRQFPKLKIFGWDRAAGTLSAKTTARRPKARTLRQDALFVEHWRALAAQVQGAVEGDRTHRAILVIMVAG